MSEKLRWVKARKLVREEWPRAAHFKICKVAGDRYEVWSYPWSGYVINTPRSHICLGSANTISDAWRKAAENIKFCKDNDRTMYLRRGY